MTHSGIRQAFERPLLQLSSRVNLTLVGQRNPTGVGIGLRHQVSSRIVFDAGWDQNFLVLLIVQSSSAPLECWLDFEKGTLMAHNTFMFRIVFDLPPTNPFLDDRRRDSAVYHLRRTHHDPGGILASASNPTRFAAAWARGKFKVVWHRSLDAATHGTIYAWDMVNIAGFRHDSPPTQKVDDGLF